MSEDVLAWLQTPNEIAALADDRHPEQSCGVLRRARGNGLYRDHVVRTSPPMRYQSRPTIRAVPWSDRTFPTRHIGVGREEDRSTRWPVSWVYDCGTRHMKRECLRAEAARRALEDGLA